MGFFSQLEKRSKEVNSLLCIGLDPHPDDLSAPDSDSAKEFCLRLIEASADVALAYKPNIAFFEIFGHEGIAALKEVIAQIPDQIPVILDAKRGDIASSAEAYAKAVFETLGADAVTINPYLGSDAVAPFLRDNQHGAFLLCKTSNPGAAEIQDLTITLDPTTNSFQTELRVYELIATRAVEWNKNDNLGLVVGATQLEALQRVRQLAPDLWILAPGVGAQEADLESALSLGLRQDGLGLVIPVSRGISRQVDPRQAAKDINSNINRVRKTFKPGKSVGIHKKVQVDHTLQDLAIDLLKSGCVNFGSYKLKSGLDSPIYIDLRRLVGLPDLLNEVAGFYLPILSRLKFERLAALPYAGLPIATAISLKGGYPLVYPRKETKSYGTQAEIEGIFSKGEQVVLIDDLATTGGSKFEAIEKLKSVGLTVEDVVVLIDRQSGAVEDLAKSGYRLHSILNLTELLDYWKETALISAGQVDAVHKFISSTKSTPES